VDEGVVTGGSRCCGEGRVGGVGSRGGGLRMRGMEVLRCGRVGGRAVMWGRGGRRLRREERKLEW